MEILTRSPKETINLGKEVARFLQPSDVICLFGKLGSGKTVLVKGIAEGFGFKKNEIVSPSFVLIKEYKKRRISLYHFDLYRLRNLKELFDLGYSEYLYADAIAVIEWADRMKEFLPKHYLKIELTIKGGNERLIRLVAFGERYKDLVRKLESEYISLRYIDKIRMYRS